MTPQHGNGAPDAPTDLKKRSWKDTLKRTFREFKEDNLTDWAAALTYYAVLSVFPALIALLSIVGLVADPATVSRVITETVSEIGPATAAETFSGPIQSITESESKAGLALILGLAAALWTASGYVGAFIRASNSMLPGFKWISPGSVVAVVVWIVASIAFAFYVANFGSYDKTYGTLGGFISFLVWLWVTNIAVLLGAEFNAELERGRQIEAGMKPKDREPFLPPRDTRKMDDPPDTEGIPDPTKRGGKEENDVSDEPKAAKDEGGQKDEGGRFARGDKDKHDEGFEPRSAEDEELRREDKPNPAEGGGFEPRTAAPKAGRVPGGGEPKVPGKDAPGG